MRAGPRHERIGTSAAVEAVKGAGPAKEHVVALAAYEQLMRAGPRHERIGTSAAVEAVKSAGPAKENVAARTAFQQLMAAGARHEEVVARTAIDTIGPGSAEHRVVTLPHHYYVVAGVMERDLIVPIAHIDEHTMSSTDVQCGVGRDIFDDCLQVGVGGDGIVRAGQYKNISLRIERIRAVADLHV